MNCFSLPHEPIPAPPMFCGDSQAEEDEDDDEDNIANENRNKVPHPFSRSQSYSEGCRGHITSHPSSYNLQQAHSHLGLLEEPDENEAPQQCPYNQNYFQQNGFQQNVHFNNQRTPPLSMKSNKFLNDYNRLRPRSSCSLSDSDSGTVPRHYNYSDSNSDVLPTLNTSQSLDLDTPHSEASGGGHSCLHTLETVVAVQQEQISVLRNTLKELASTYTRREQALLAKIVTLQKNALVKLPNSPTPSTKSKVS